MIKKRQKQQYFYRCGVTDKQFKMTREALRPDDLISIEAYYEMHPEEDDRPKHMKKQTSSE